MAKPRRDQQRAGAVRRAGLCSLWTCAFVLALPAWAQPAPAAPAPFKVAHSARECIVWKREQSFARSVETHDARAFAAHVHPDAVFNAGSAEAEHGREPIVRSWAGLIEGRELVLRWRPGVVNIGGDPDIALSRGPYMLEDRRAGAATPFRVGLFQSVWVRDRESGEWRVLFDGSASEAMSVESAEGARQYVAANSPPECSPG
ncbi:MAG TPA: nuclear transport factor 2 family protein [Caldimonas sp.]